MSLNHSSLSFSSSSQIVPPPPLWWYRRHHHRHDDLMEEDQAGNLYPNPYSLSKPFVINNVPSNVSSSSSNNNNNNVTSLPFQYPTTNYHHPTSWLNPYTYHHHPPPPTQTPPPPALLFDLNHQDNDAAEAEPAAAETTMTREHLFEKPLTPSDVGKLNRLVIPKQHAEKYFPLGGDSVEKGMVLSFEDESGKSWKFRYSYWNSSQSYVLTKGWSRYVKEKQLDAGDVVLFQRHRFDGERLFIGWRRRGDSNNGTSGSGVGRSATTRGSCSSSSIASNNNNNNNSNNVIISDVFRFGAGINATGGVQQFQTEFLHPGTMAQDQSTSIGNSKRLRLFGVNLECQVDDQSSEPSTPDGSSMSSQGHHHLYNPQPAYSYSSSSPSHMDGITFPQDVNQMSNRRG